MAIPDYQSLMLPLLRIAADGREHRFRDAVEQLASEFRLTAAERAHLLPSGTAPLFDNRVGWARTYLKQAGLLSSPKRGLSFVEFRAGRKDKDDPVQTLQLLPEQPTPSETPEEALADAYKTLRQNLETELLDQVRAASPAFFERLVIDLLVAMGYGGSRQDAGRAIGRSGDEGIDGIIKEDKLGLDAIYVQAKRWEDSVGRPDIQKFAGALQGQRATKGVFITTSTFSRDAEQYVNAINSKIILIDGERLASLMIDHNVGVAGVGVYELKRVDSDYFEGA